MFSDAILEKILSREDVMKVPFENKYTMLHAINEVLEKENVIREDMKSEQPVYE